MLAYHLPAQALPGMILHCFFSLSCVSLEDEYLQCLHLFTNEQQLLKILVSLAKDEQEIVPKDGRPFFEKKYGKVDGKEVEKLMEIRKWKEPLNTETSVANSVSIDQIETTLRTDLEAGKFHEDSIITAADYFALSWEVPQDILEFERVFLRRHQPQLEAIGLPRNLWVVRKKIRK